VNIGRFGPYVKWGDDFISIPRGIDMASVDINKAIHLIEEKKRAMHQLLCMKENQ
jgi:DNA topoisomerase-1